jgi:hypothetical protein
MFKILQSKRGRNLKELPSSLLLRMQHMLLSKMKENLG